ncbi:MAG: lysine transporter LysE [Denitrovibrio sp.]|nr:MAG: lysine transporter LysE [Denitrovibrio sp.]
MLELDQILLFASTAILLALAPGPDILYVVTRGITQGRSSALAAAAGFSIGNIVHTTFAIIGVSAIIKASATAFTIIKIAGAIYLIYIGIKIFRSGSASAEKDKKLLAPKTVFIQSFTANILNPKVAIFFIALFPQFIRSQNGHESIQMALLGAEFILCTFFVFSACALFSGHIGEFLKKKQTSAGLLNKLAGAVLIGLGVALAFSKR